MGHLIWETSHKGRGTQVCDLGSSEVTLKHWVSFRHFQIFSCGAANGSHAVTLANAGPSQPSNNSYFLSKCLPLATNGDLDRGSTQVYDATVSPIHSLWTACHANSLSGNRKMLSAQRKTRTQTHPIAVNVSQADKYVKEPPTPFPGTSCHLPRTTDRGLGVKRLTDPRTFPPAPPHPGTAAGEQQRPEST